MIPEIHESLEAVASLPAPAMLDWACRAFGARFAIVTAFQPEGMILVDMAFAAGHNPRLITIDTGRLPQETYEMIDAVRRRYGAAVEVASPDAAEMERMVSLHGANLFRQAVPLRRLCCHIRKVRPLEAKLAGISAWAAGLRREQSEERAALEPIGRDEQGRIKLNPLAGWTHDEVRDYTRLHDLPRHPLLLAGYATVGCAPCTRPVEEGEDARAGRWWWEQDAGKECGIHATPSGQFRRTLDVLLDEILH